MKRFSELGIETTVKSFEGDKISIETILNKEVKVLAYRIVKSKYEEKGNGRCLHIQLEFNNEKRVLFTGSGYLMDTIERAKDDDFPFATTIVKQNKRLEFT